MRVGDIGMGPGSQFYTVEDALRIGADAVAVSAFPGSATEEETLRTLANVLDKGRNLVILRGAVPGPRGAMVVVRKRSN